MVYDPALGATGPRGTLQPAPGSTLDQDGNVVPPPRHAADDYADIRRRTRNLWITRKEEP
jgi:hypothetical protein